MNTTEITVSRTIPAPPERIFDVWLDPKRPGGPWHGTEGVIFIALVDGLFYLPVKHEGRIWPHYGRFLQIDRPHRIEFTWVSEATKGLETVVLLSLEPKGNSTEVTLRHSGMSDDEMGSGHKEGWTWSLSALADCLTSK
jgi:uncharacterized protein YndB with AHSA1/START domain